MHAPEFIPEDYFRELAVAEIFPDSPERPLEIDLGCGDGGFLLEMARLLPGRNFLGVERVRGRVHRIREDIRRAGFANVRVLRLDSSYVVGWLLPAGSVSRLHLLCPDPWPKKKHHKNRLVRRREFLDGLGRILVAGGEFLLKTDQEDYFEEALEHVDAQSWAERTGWEEGEIEPYPETDFERQWVAMGREIHRARWRRISSE